MVLSFGAFFGRWDGESVVGDQGVASDDEGKGGFGWLKRGVVVTGLAFSLGWVS